MTSALLRTAAMAIAATLVTACGGGSSSPSPSTPNVGATLPASTPKPAASPTPASTPTPAGTPTPATTSTLATAQVNGALAFVTAAGRTVYIFDADLAAPGTSVCNGACAGVWPPIAPPAGVALSTGFTTIRRSDGTTQLTYKARPLYLYIGDSAPGQGNGDGITAFGGLWHVSRPAGSSTGTSPSPPPSGY
jgi:predicted lipoprotein with Yx(FWY)xxD motif